MIYLDNCATTKIHPDVLAAMLPYLQEEYGNPSSKYYSLAENARKAVETARVQVADLLNCKSDEIIFTSGSSESNNFILKGVADHYQTKGRHIITSPVEHKSVLAPCEYLEKRGYTVTYLPVNQWGQVEPETLANAIQDDTILISLMWGNNELGSLNDIAALSNIAKEKQVFFHTDATQVVGKIPVDLQTVPVDFLSLSAHKLHGPKGVGACFIRKDDLGLRTPVTPLIHGGGQERDYRSGTLAVHNIVGLGAACLTSKNSFQERIKKINENETLLLNELGKMDTIQINSPDCGVKIPGIINFSHSSIKGELLCKLASKEAISISTGSACSFVGSNHIFVAIGMSDEQSQRTIRLSFNELLSQNELQNLITFIRNQNYNSL